MIDRRSFVIALAAVGLSAPRAAGAQGAGKTARLGVLRPAQDNPVFRRDFEGCRQVLHEAGYVEGRNLGIEYRVRGGSRDEIFATARELAGRKVDAILAIAPLGVAAAAHATTTIPVVGLDLETDPVASGLVASLARPGRNVTGVFLDFPELSGKWLQLLAEGIPKLSRVAVLWDPATGPTQVKAAEAAAQSLRLQLQPLEARRPDDLAAAVRTATRERAGALLVLSSPVFNSARRRIAELAHKNRLPAIMPFPGFAEDGGLMAYGPHLHKLFGQVGAMLVRILTGSPPGTIPIERPATFNFIVNLKTAKSLGLTIPQSLLARADEVIQ